MENNKFTKAEKLIAKKNFLALEANYTSIKRLANKSSNAADYNIFSNAAAKSFLSGYATALGNEYLDNAFRIIYKNYPTDKTLVAFGDMPDTKHMAQLNKIYFHIKHNKIDNINNDNYWLAYASYLIDENTEIKSITLY